MIILNNMYTGRYITQLGNLGHEIINLFKADDNKFYIWLNSMGVCNKTANGATVIMVRSISSSLYKVLAKAENCELCDGADLKRSRKGVDNNKKERYEAQKKLNVTYRGKQIIDIFSRQNNEEDMFATFCTTEFYETQGEIYLTNDKSQEDESNGVYYANFKISEAMRAYISYNDKLEDFLRKPIWTEPTTNIKEFSEDDKPEFNFFKLLKKDKDELSFSNAIAYYIEKFGIANFIKDCLKPDERFLKDKYDLFREKTNIDISFFGDENVIIIENKIGAGITRNSNTTKESQIQNATRLYYDLDSCSEYSVEDDFIKELKQFVDSGNHKGNVSQLSKYYIYAVAYLLNKGVSVKEVDAHIKCYLLVPNYARKLLTWTKDDMFAEKYYLITYKEIFDFFKLHENEDKYINDFISALRPLTSEFDNEIEKEMKCRFFEELQNS